MVVIVAVGVVLLVLGAALLSMAALSLSFAPWVPSSAQTARAALHLADVRPGEHVVDLGSGTGGVLMVAAREFGARATGYERGPLLVAISRLRARLGGVSVDTRFCSLFEADLGDADVVFAFPGPHATGRLQAFLQERMVAGGRVVIVSFPLPGPEPERVALGSGKTRLYLYRFGGDSER